MPRWISENNDKRRDLFGFPLVQTQTMDCSQATVFEGTTQREELEQQLHLGAQKLKQMNQVFPVSGVHPQGQKLPPGAVLQTDWNDRKRELFYVGYMLGENFVRFARPFPCNPPKDKEQKK
jgi:hypothetical protein